MRVEIINVDCFDDEVRVLFSSDFGNAYGRWTVILPEPGLEYYVEIDIDDDLLWGVDIVETSATDGLISMSDSGRTRLSGWFESIDDNGCSILRLGGHIISFTTQGVSFKIGTYIEISTVKLELFQYDY